MFVVDSSTGQWWSFVYRKAQHLHKPIGTVLQLFLYIKVGDVPLEIFTVQNYYETHAFVTKVSANNLAELSGNICLLMIIYRSN